MSVEEHRQGAIRQVAVMVITVSDSRTAETDRSGKLIRDLLAEAGHRVIRYELVPDEGEAITRAVGQGLDHPQVQVILLNGGTGIAKRDVTHETVSSLLEKEMPGFGELFRQLSFGEIGPAAMLSRAVAGTARGKAIFAMPGSTGAVRLAMEKLILPELGHIVRELEKD